MSPSIKERDVDAISIFIGFKHMDVKDYLILSTQLFTIHIMRISKINISKTE
jgi:hypothetical protein